MSYMCIILVYYISCIYICKIVSKHYFYFSMVIAYLNVCTIKTIFNSCTTLLLVFTTLRHFKSLILSNMNVLIKSYYYSNREKKTSRGCFLTDQLDNCFIRIIRKTKTKCWQYIPIICMQTDWHFIKRKHNMCMAKIWTRNMRVQK